MVSKCAQFGSFISLSIFPYVFLRPDVSQRLIRYMPRSSKQSCICGLGLWHDVGISIWINTIARAFKVSNCANRDYIEF